MNKETDQLGKDILKQLSHLLSFSRDISLGTDRLIQKMPQADEVFHSKSFSSIEKEIFDINCFTDYFTGPAAEQVLPVDDSSILQDHPDKNLFAEDHLKSESKFQKTGSAIQSSQSLHNTRSEITSGNFHLEKTGDNTPIPDRTKVGSFSDLFKKVSETEKINKEPVAERGNLSINGDAESANISEPLQNFSSEVSNNFLRQLKQISATSDNKDLVKLAAIVESLVFSNPGLAGNLAEFESESSGNARTSVLSENRGRNSITNISAEENFRKADSEYRQLPSPTYLKKNKSVLLREIESLKNSSSEISALAEIVKVLLVQNSDYRNDSGIKASVTSEDFSQITHNAAEKTTNFFHGRIQTFNENQVNLNKQTGGIPTNENQIASGNPVDRKLRIEDVEAQNTSTSFINSYAREDNSSAFSNDFNENKFSEPVIERFRSEKPAAKFDDAAYKMSKELRLNFQRYFSE